jgi:hypothetical protein
MESTSPSARRRAGILRDLGFEAAPPNPHTAAPRRLMRRLRTRGRHSSPWIPATNGADRKALAHARTNTGGRLETSGSDAGDS